MLLLPLQHNYSYYHHYDYYFCPVITHVSIAIIAFTCVTVLQILFYLSITERKVCLSVFVCVCVCVRFFISIPSVKAVFMFV